MKSILILIGILSGFIGKGQILYPEELTCSGSFDSPLTSLSLPCHLTFNDFSIDAATDQDFSAVNAISIYANSDFSLSGGNVELSLRMPEINLAWYEPVGQQLSVPQYSKVEIGIELPTWINDQVQNFISDPNAAGGINPYDPDMLDVFALISQEVSPGVWSSPERANCF